MNLETVLGSAVIAAIFSGLVSYIISRKKGKLQYITGERKKWREKIRRIASELNGATYKKTLQILTKLKVRINAFGNNGVSTSYNSDAHIWELINEIEAEKPKKNILKLQQKQMIEYLALLLKNDWERSKKEVKGENYGIISMFLFTASCVYFSISIFNSHIKDFSIFELISFDVLYLVLIGITNGVLITEIKVTCNRILSGTINNEVKNYKISKLIQCYIMWGVTVIVLMIFNIFILSLFSKTIFGEGNDLIIATVSYYIYACACGILFWAQANKAEQIYYYNDSINKARSNYTELKNKIKSDSNQNENKNIVFVRVK